MSASFVVITDTHFQPPGVGENMTWWNRMIKEQGGEISEAIVSAIKKTGADFIIHCGDFTDEGAIESYEYGKQIMESCGCPLYFTPGNHDTWQPNTREKIAGLFENDDGKFYFARELGGVRFIFLDCAYWITADGEEHEHIDWTLNEKGGYAGIGPTNDELAWFGNELKTNAEQPAIIVAHTPIYAKPAYPVGSLPMGKPVRQDPSPFSHFAGYCSRRDALLRLIEGAKNVKAFFAGHWHICDITNNAGVTHCQTGAMIEFPFEMRLCKIDRERLTVTIFGLDDSRLQQDSIVPELNNTWVAGEKEDREFSLNLT